MLYADAVTKWEKRRFYVKLKGQEKREKAKKKKAIDMKKAAMSDELLNLAKENKVILDLKLKFYYNYPGSICGLAGRLGQI